jgi:hypothetical protein
MCFKQGISNEVLKYKNTLLWCPSEKYIILQKHRYAAQIF